MSKTQREVRQELAEKSPVKISTEFDYKDIDREKIDYQRPDGTWAKVSLYSSNFSSCENVCACYQHFNKKCQELGWQGQDRFTYWSNAISPTALATWDSAVAEGPNNHQEATFLRAIRVVLSRIAGNGAYEALEAYLNEAKKPYSMNTAQLAVRLNEIQQMSSFFLQEDGNPGPAFTDFQIRRWMVRLHPTPWVTNFTNAGKKALTETMPTLIEYFNEQAGMEKSQRQTPKKRSTPSNDNNDSKKPRNDRNNGNGRGGRGGGRNNNGRNSRGGRGNGGGRGGTQSSHQGGIDPDSHCPVHPNGNHLWRKCTHNPKADADAPTLRFYRNQPVSNPSGAGRGQPMQYRPSGAYFMSSPGSMNPGFVPADTMYGSGGYGSSNRGMRSGSDHFYVDHRPNFNGDMSNMYRHPE